jgi:L-fucose isomerase-like protein
MQTMTYALYYGNRGFFPASLIAGAREELPRALKAQGLEHIQMDAAATRYGAVETPDEGRKYAEFLAQNRGKFHGVILCLPNFGDETGAVAALREAGVPILVQAYPDEMDKMGPANRRDSFCGKLSIMDVFHQSEIPFTAMAPHTVHPSHARFKENLAYFDRVCRVVRAGRRMTVGALGARTSPFRTVRIDELALEKHGVTVETMDMADVFARMRAVKPQAAGFAEKRHSLDTVAAWDGVPEAARENLTRLFVVLEAITEEMSLAAISIRCWTEIQKEMGISPCVVNGIMADQGLPVACEVDTGSAVMMRLLGAAAAAPTAIMDWNNNYGEDDDRCILFHCGNAPSSLMAAPGKVTDHAILSNSIGTGKGFGCNQGRLKAGAFTFGGLMSENGALKAYLGEGDMTADPIPGNFFGVAGVAKIPGLQDVLLHLGREGHRHHVVLTPGNVMESAKEGMEKYLGYLVTAPQKAKV